MAVTRLHEGPLDTDEEALWINRSGGSMRPTNLLRHLAASERVERKFPNSQTWLTGGLE
jgi:hypothetical protein